MKHVISQIFFGEVNTQKSHSSISLYLYKDLLLVHWFDDLPDVRALFLEQLQLFPQQSNLGVQLIPLCLKTTNVLSLL